MNAQNKIAPRAKAQTYALSAGTLTLTDHGFGDYPIYEIAERQNPRRAFLFVSTILGRHIPVKPSVFRGGAAILADRARRVIPGLSPVLVMSYAETAVGIGAAVFDELCRLRGSGSRMAFLPTTRHIADEGSAWLRIREEHSHAADHMIMPLRFSRHFAGPGATLVLVDDESTTGKTFAELVRALRSKGMLFTQIVLCTLTDWSMGAAVAAVGEEMPGAEVTAISLTEGQWHWAQDPDAIIPSLPGAIAPQCAPFYPAPDDRFAAPRAGRNPMTIAADHELTRDVCTRLISQMHGRRTLVIGTGEHVWQPFLVAEHLEHLGHDVRMIATTRSPIMQGQAIRHKLTFGDHYGIGVEMYLHNVNRTDYDDVILFIEDSTDRIPQALAAGLGSFLAVDGAGHITRF